MTRASEAVDEALLTDDERGQYRRLLETSPTKAEAARIEKQTSQIKGIPALVALAIAALVGFGAVAGNTAPSAFGPVVAVGAVVALAGWAIGGATHQGRLAAARRHALDAFLVSIRYAERTAQPASVGTSERGDDVPNYWATGGYDPDRFHQIVASHSQHELDAMKEYGISADDWDANRPD